MKLSLIRIYWIFIIFVFCPGVISCSKVLSERTDEGVWLEHRLETQSARSPATLGTSGTSPISVLLKKDLDKTPVRTYLLKCGASAHVQTCFETEMTRRFDEVFRKIRGQHSELLMANYRQEQRDFLKTYSYANTVEEVERFHQTLLSGIDLKSREAAAELFSACDSEGEESASIDRFDLYLGGVTELPKSVYACIVKRWDLELQQVLDENLDRLGLELKTNEAKAWIRARLLAPIFESELAELGKRRAAEELKQFEEMKSEIFNDFDFKKSETELVRTWAPRLREKFPYSPVEQWVSAHLQKRKAQ